MQNNLGTSQRGLEELLPLDLDPLLFLSILFNSHSLLLLNLLLLNLPLLYFLLLNFLLKIHPLNLLLSLFPNFLNHLPLSGPLPSRYYTSRTPSRPLKLDTNTICTSAQSGRKKG